VFRDGGLPAIFQLLSETAQGSIDSILDIITSNLPTMFEKGRQKYFATRLVDGYRLGYTEHYRQPFAVQSM
jgi:hypothetical protein